MARIGVQASTIKAAFGELGVYETLRRVSEVGYHAVEISQIPMTPDNVAEMRRAADELGMRVAALSAGLTTTPGIPWDSLADDFDKIVADSAALDCSILRIGMLPFDAMASLNRVVDFSRRMNDAARRLADEGIDLYYHNHHIEFARFDGRYLLDVIAEEAPAVGLELDVHWIHRGGLDPVRVLAQYAGRVRLVHLKDYRIGTLPAAAFDMLAAGDFGGFMNAFTNVVQFAEVGEGSLDWPAILDQALASGAEYLLVEQDDTYGRDPFDSLAISRANLVELGYGHLF